MGFRLNGNIKRKRQKNRNFQFSVFLTPIADRADRQSVSRARSRTSFDRNYVNLYVHTYRYHIWCLLCVEIVFFFVTCRCRGQFSTNDHFSSFVVCFSFIFFCLFKMFSSLSLNLHRDRWKERGRKTTRRQKIQTAYK